MHDTSPWCSVSPNLSEFALSLKLRFVTPLLTAVGILPLAWKCLLGSACWVFLLSVLLPLFVFVF